MGGKAKNQSEEGLTGASESRLRAIFDSTSVALGFGDLRGNFLEINPAFEQLLGYTIDELKHIGPSGITHPGDIFLDAPHLKGLLEEKHKVLRLEKRYLHKDGHVVWGNLSVSLVRTAGGEPHHCIVAVEDITRRKKAELQLETSRRFLSIANEHTDLQQMLAAFVKEIQRMSGCEAVGIRLLNEADRIPYASYTGFSQKFYETESPLSLKSDRCMCINVASGTTDPAQSFYTRYGSFYSNGTTRLLGTLTEKDKSQMRNACNAAGYESVALIPLKEGARISGLIHIADRRENMVPLETVQNLQRVSETMAIGIQRAQGREQLRRSEQHFRSLIHNAGDAIYLIDAKTGRITECNRQASVMLGYSGEELVGMDTAGIEAKLSKAEIDRIHSKLKLEPNITLEGIHRRKDGSTFPVEIRLSRLEPEDASRLIATVRDITERKQAEEAIRMSEERLRLATEATGFGIYSWDFTTGQAYYSPEFLELFGLPQDSRLELDGDFVARAIHPEDKALFLEKMHAANDPGGNGILDMEYRIIRADGRMRWLRVRGRTEFNWFSLTDKPLRASGIIQDITESKDAEEALHEKDRRYLALFENMLHGFAHCRMIFEDGKPVDYVYISVNPAFEMLTGLKGAAGKKASELIPGIRESNPELLNIYGRVSETGAPQTFEDYVVPLKIWFHISVYSPRKGEFVATFDNITKNKQAEEELLRLNRLYAVISHVNQAVVHATSQEEFLEQVCEVITDYGNFKLAWLGKLDHETNRILPVAAAGTAKDYITGIHVSAGDGPEGRGPIGACVRSNKPVVQNDFMNDPNTQPWHERAKPLGLRGSAAFPVVMGGQVWGALAVYSDSVGYFGAKEINLLEEAAGDIGFALDNFKKEKLRRWAEDEMRRTATELQQSEERFRSLYENSTIGIYRTTPGGAVLAANPALVRMLGYGSFDELSAHNLENSHYLPSYPRSRFLEEIEKEGEISGLESPWKRKDGSLMFVRESARAILDTDGQTLYYDGTIEDISESKESEEKLRHLNQTLLAVRQVNGLIAHEQNRKALLDGACSTLVTVRGFDRCWMAVLDTEGKPVAEAEDNWGEDFTAVRTQLESGSLPHCAAEAVKLRKAIIRTEDARSTDSADFRPDDFKGTARSIIAPMRYGDRVMGVISASVPRSMVIEAEEINIFQELADDIGFALNSIEVESKRREAEEGLRQSEARYRLLSENSGDVIWTLDIKTLKFTYVSPSVFKLRGYTPDEVTSQPVELAMTPASYKLITEGLGPRIQAFLSGDESMRVMTTPVDQPHRDGSIINTEVVTTLLTDEKGRVTSILGATRDISERKRAEGSLKENEAKFRSAFMTGMDAFYIATLEEGLILEINDNFEGLFGYSREEVIGKTSLALGLYANPVDRARMVVELKAKGSVRDLELQARKKSGEIITISISISTLTLNDNKHILGIVRDISDRVKSAEERKRLEEKTQMAGRLAAVGEMAAGVAHEINNPLTSVLGFSELLLEQDLPEKARLQARFIADGSKRVSEIIKRMLTFARQNKPARKQVDINSLIENTLMLRSYVLQTAGIRVMTCYDSHLPLVNADPGLLQQVFMNLVVNAEQAIKSGHRGGTLNISTEKSGDGIRIIFRDDGPGISPENLPRLFEPFFTTKGSVDGTGLGLSISHTIVSEHGGEIRAESEPGKGAAFIIDLPVKEFSAKSETETPAAQQAAAGPGPVKVLVVDDEQSVGDFISAVLSGAGHTVEATCDPQEVPSMLAKNDYSVVFIDVRMPGMSGDQLFEAIIKKHPNMAEKVVFMTGDVSDAGVQSFLKLNRLPFLTKPFQIKELKNIMRVILEPQNRG